MPNRPSLRSKLAGLCRASVLAALCVPLVTAATVRAAQSEVGQRGLRIGRELAAAMRELGPGSQLTINGNTLFAGGRNVEAELPVVLDRFEAHCNEFGWDIRGDLAREKAIVPSEPFSITLGKQRTENEGLIVCLVSDERQVGLSRFLERARITAETGDISRVGQVRYLYARRNPNGGTDVVTVNTIGDFNVKRLFSTVGDVTGSDLPDIPRPAGSTRTLFVELGNSPFAIRSYTTAAVTPARALAGYRQSLPASGWQVLDVGQSAPSTLTVTKDGAALIITADIQNDLTRVDFVQLGSRGFAVVDGSGARL